MTQEELHTIIEQLEANVLKGHATFGIQQYGGGADESFIQADKEGLKLFALELLKAAHKADDTLDHNDKNIIPIECEEEWINDQSDTIIQYIEPVAQRKPKPVQDNYQSTLADKLVPAGCYAIFIILIVSIIVGLWTLAKWVF